MGSDKIRVIIADDHIVLREGTRELLQKESDLEVVGESGDGECAALLLIPEDFADQAVAAFANEVSKVTETVAKTF